MDKIKILLADDEELFRKGIAFLLSRQENIEIIFEASNGFEVISFLENDAIIPDIILMDLKMPVLNGVEATKIITKKYPNSKIIALTSYNTQSFIANMIEVGAVSYLVKNSTPDKMLFTINEVAQKGFYYDDEVLALLNSEILKSNKTPFDSNYLTQREKEVLQCICNQMNTNEISQKLFISPRTVEGHRNNLLLKTESKNIAGLVVFAIQHSLVLLNDI